jgi:gas vesicle protein
MGQDAEELTTTPSDIEATRANLSRDIDELSDKVSPQRVVERRKEAAKNSLASVRDKLMGTAQDDKGEFGAESGASTSGPASAVKDSAQNAAGALGSATSGNPLTAGLVAFGAGMLISALLPASTKETEAATRLVDAAKEHGQPLLDEAKSAGQEIGKDLGERAAQAAQEVKAQAQDSAENVKREGQSSVDQVKDEAPST